MDEEKKKEQNKADLKIKETITNQLDSFINPTEETKNKNINTTFYYPEIEKEKKAELLIKIANIPNPEEILKQNRPIIRTYKSDVEEIVQANHISSINIAMAENKKMMEKEKQIEKEKKKNVINKSILIISLVLILGGILTFFIPQLLIQMQYGEKKIPLETISSKPIITVDLEEKINIKDINLNRVDATLKERVEQSSTKLGQIKNIFLTKGEETEEHLIKSSKFLELIKANVPPEIQRTLKDSYMFGLHNYNGNQKFLILKIGLYDTAFSGMLHWEINLWQDFKELFNLQTEIKNSTSSNSYEIEIKKFQDIAFNNKDCRVIKNSLGEIKFLYSIIDKNTIIFTTSKDTLNEIINRMSKARIITR
ncbi:MAG: hypothetical protein V1910_00140 [bacterium]